MPSEGGGTRQWFLAMPLPRVQSHKNVFIECKSISPATVMQQSTLDNWTKWFCKAFNSNSFYFFFFFFFFFVGVHGPWLCGSYRRRRHKRCSSDMFPLKNMVNLCKSSDRENLRFPNERFIFGRDCLCCRFLKEYVDCRTYDMNVWKCAPLSHHLPSLWHMWTHAVQSPLKHAWHMQIQNNF